MLDAPSEVLRRFVVRSLLNMPIWLATATQYRRGPADMT